MEGREWESTDRQVGPNDMTCCLGQVGFIFIVSFFLLISLYYMLYSGPPHPRLKHKTVGPFFSFFYNGNNVPHPCFKCEMVGPFSSFFLQWQQSAPTLASNARRWGHFLLFFFTMATMCPTLASNARWWGHFLLFFYNSNNNAPHPHFKHETVGLFPSFYNSNNSTPHPHFKRETVGPFPSSLQRQQQAPPSLQTWDGGAVFFKHGFFFF